MIILNTNNMRLSALTLAIHDDFENLSLIFREKDSANNIFSVEFSFIDIRFINDERIVLGGTLEVKSNSQKSNGTIEYNFSKNKFYRVLYYANGTIRRIHELELNPVWNNMKYVNNFLYFVSNFLYSEEDYETNHVNRDIGPAASAAADRLRRRGEVSGGLLRRKGCLHQRQGRLQGRCSREAVLWPDCHGHRLSLSAGRGVHPLFLR